MSAFDCDVVLVRHTTLTLSAPAIASMLHKQSHTPTPLVHAATQATVIMTALNIKCAACGSRIKNGLQAKFGSHLKSVRTPAWRRSAETRLQVCCTAVHHFQSHYDVSGTILQVEIQEKSKAVVVRLADQAAVTNQALLAAMNELDSPASLVRRDIHPQQ